LQDPASCNLDAIKKQIDAAIKGRIAALNG
jgi:hypothetical protein